MANPPAFTKASNLAICSGCGKGFHPKNLRWCRGCMVDRYCGGVCQKAHWKAHKRDCAQRRRARKAPHKGTSTNERGNALVSRFERLLERGRADEAKAALDEALALGHPRAMHMKARVLVDEGDVDGGIALFEQMISAGLGDGEGGSNAGLLEYNAARALMLRGGASDCGRAVDLFDVALGKKPKNAGAMVMKGVVLKMLGRRTEALAAFDDAITGFGDNLQEASTAHYNAGDIRLQDHDLAAAAEHFRFCVRAHANDHASRRKLILCENPNLVWFIMAALTLGPCLCLYCFFGPLAKKIAIAGAIFFSEGLLRRLWGTSPSDPAARVTSPHSP